jgi:hypothetical protein
MARHLATCAPGHDSQAERTSLVHLLIEASSDPRSWLHLEGRGDASLEMLDRLLRDTWLECCEHMSAFYVAGLEPDMESRLGSVFCKKGNRFRYEYDFGTPTRLQGRVIGFREGSIGTGAVRLLARNTAPTRRCAACGSPADVLLVR